MVDRLIVLTRQHVGEMQDTWIVSYRNLVPALLLVDDVSDDLGVSPASGADGLGERFSVLEVLFLHAGVEGQEVQHGHGASAFDLLLAERFNPVAEFVGEFEALG